MLAHFLDGGWTEIVESLNDEEGERLFDDIESAHGSCLACRAAKLLEKARPPAKFVSLLTRLSQYAPLLGN